jgi:hypothetical protein
MNRIIAVSKVLEALDDLIAARLPDWQAAAAAASGQSGEEVRDKGQKC